MLTAWMRPFRKIVLVRSNGGLGSKARHSAYSQVMSEAAAPADGAAELRVVAAPRLINEEVTRACITSAEALLRLCEELVPLPLLET
jgi:hypothetical protein